MTPYGFDISILENIENPTLVEHIKRVGRVFYEADATKNHGCQ
jgi:hypothetical protein